MHRKQTTGNPGHRSRRLLAIMAGGLLAATVGVFVNAAPTTKPYTATWLDGSSPVANPPNVLNVAAGNAALRLRITNNSSQQQLGSANITPPSGYSLGPGSTVSQGAAPTLSGNTLQLRDLGLAPGASLTATINVATSCLGDGVARAWSLTVKQANNFSGPPGNDFSRASGTAAPATAITSSACQLRFANQPNTTETNAVIRDGFNSTGNPIRVEIFDPATGLVVNSPAQVTISRYYYPSGGALTGGGPVTAVAGVATFSNLRIDAAGAYRLRATSAAASNAPVTSLFMIADTVEACSGDGCSFTQTRQQSSYTVAPEAGTAGAGFVGALNLAGLKISCAGAPWYYPDNRQPNAVWFDYNGSGAKVVTIQINKRIVQETTENGASFYRVCFSSPDPFMARNGAMAPPDPWTTPDGDGRVGPSTYFGVTWYTGLLPDCSAVDNVAPCVVSWTGTRGGDRLGTFVAKPGDPLFR